MTFAHLKYLQYTH